MIYPLLIKPAAEEDLGRAFDWYQRQRKGLGHEFLSAVDVALKRIQTNPETYADVHRGTRRALLRKFPYAVYYRIDREQVVVTAVMHASRQPRRWQRRG